MLHSSAISVLRVRLRRHEATVALAADAAARVPLYWLAVTAALCVITVALATLATWQAWSATAAVLRRRLPAALTTWLPLRVLVAVATVTSTHTMLLILSGALLDCDDLSDAVTALNRATYLAAARAGGWRVPLLRDAAACEARCAAQLRVWSCRALIEDMRAAVRTKRIGARRALAIMAATAAVAEPCTGHPDEQTLPMPGTAAEVEAFLALPCDEEEGDDDGAAATVGLCGVDQIIQVALEGSAQQAPPALQEAPTPKEAPTPQYEEWPPRRRNEHFKAVPGNRHARRAAKRRQQHPAPSDTAANEHADDAGDDTHGAPAADDDSRAPETPPPPSAAPRARDRSGWRTVEAMLTDGGWRFVRRGGHVMFKRSVRLAGSGATVTQSFVAPCTPSDTRAGRNAAAKLRRLDQGVMPLAA